MDLYHWWLYENMLNTEWFVWSMVFLILGGNILSPIVLWMIMSGKKLPFFKKRKQQNRT